MSTKEELQEKLKQMSPEELLEFQKQQCIFCHLVQKKIPSKIIYEDEKVVAILDKNPAKEGHILLLPKEHFMIMPQVPEELLGHLFQVAQRLSQAQLKAFNAQGITILVANGPAAGQRAQHFMAHLIPRHENDGLGLMVDKQQVPLDLQLKVKQMLQKSLGLIKDPDAKPATKPELKKPEAITEKEAQPEPTKNPSIPPTKKTTQDKKPALLENEETEEKESGIDLDAISDLFK
jgi:histidine triad (HIT) family protein